MNNGKKEIVIDETVPMPEGRRALSGDMDALRTVLLKMKVGDSFVWPDNKHPYRAAIETKTRITTRKINGDGYRIWRRE